MSVCICIFFLPKKYSETKLAETETVSELRELFECNVFFIIIINMKKNILKSEDWLRAMQFY